MISYFPIQYLPDLSSSSPYLLLGSAAVVISLSYVTLRLVAYYVRDQFTGLNDLKNAAKSSNIKGAHAVVIGASWAGSLTTRVLLNHFERVTLVELEAINTDLIFCDSAKMRKNVGQESMGHALLTYGFKAACQLVPSAVKIWKDNGCEPQDFSKLNWFHYQGYIKNDKDTGHDTCFVSRCLLESSARHVVTSENKDRVTFMSGTKVNQIILDPATNSCKGILYETTNAKGEVVSGQILADLIVDATGVSRKGEAWLNKAGIKVPKENIGSYIGYYGGFIPVKQGENYLNTVVHPEPSQGKRYGGGFNVEHGHVVTTVIGVAKDYPTKDISDMIPYMAQFPDIKREFSKLDYKEAKHMSYFAVPNTTLMRYDLVNMPNGFVAVGDAACRFNPTYGQGLSCAALGAVTLDRILRSQTSLNDVSNKYHRLLFKRIYIPWTLPKALDYYYKEVDAAEGENKNALFFRFVRSFVKVMFASTHYSSDAARMVLGVMAMNSSPASLASPWLLSYLAYIALSGKQ